MHLTFFVVFGVVLHNNLPSESRKVTPDGLVLDGYKANAFRRITTHLIEKHIVKKLGSCALRCSKNLECVSFNFGNPIQGTHDCELIRTDKYNSRSSYNTSKDFHHFCRENKCMDPSSCLYNGSCYPDYDNDDYHCVCGKKSYGTNCEILIRSDCSKFRSSGYTTDGVYQINPDGQGSFPVYCDMTTDGGGWTVFQRHLNGSVDFNRLWQDYKTGFGNVTSEFWLGLDKIHRLTKIQVTKLRIDLEGWDGKTGYAVYSSFSLADESDFYRLNVSGHSGTVGDSIANTGVADWDNNNKRFSTPDNDNDVSDAENCAYISKGGWWYGYCSLSDLNGRKSWSKFGSSLKCTQMKLR